MMRRAMGTFLPQITKDEDKSFFFIQIYTQIY